jgi:hypothetical protein
MFKDYKKKHLFSSFLLANKIEKSNGFFFFNFDKKPPQIFDLQSKRPHTITKIKDNINMDSTIAGSVNDNINMDITIARSVNA